MEDRGDVRGGRFVGHDRRAVSALPIAVESLRAMRHRQPTGELVTGCPRRYPLNLVRILVPGESRGGQLGQAIGYRDGVFVEPTAAVERAVS
jgi:ATP-dependent Lhr-like helicase